eukprot:CAMPEP_0113719384 /NCGR_PEP_ID=MMETSP0038_2-20120614/35770_1 /TAXON_ID=2898 /ORGANISM="Cryptomonas paramecium" /LENGTH=380 /DNA_ID=CAMNT_0000647721 /DNA_START=62 /DNA_END=1200 /DNA_ORIENTATION=- /assembly_acc=CAM_ASM_000170
MSEEKNSDGAEAPIDHAQVLDACADFDAKWKAFQQRFGEALNKGLANLFQGLTGVSMTPPELPEEEQRMVFDGETPSLEQIGKKLAQGKYKNIVVCVGAGLSTSAGIPDFRTPGSGLYDNLQRFDLPTPQSIFDLDYYRTNPLPFAMLSREIWPGERYRPTPGHAFLRMLHDKGLLLRVFTQNIDGLERLAGVLPEKLVECHGTFASASCIDCRHPADPRDYLEQATAYAAMHDHTSSSSSAAAAAAMSEEEREAEARRGAPRCKQCGGLIKPDIVFFGEDLPPAFAERRMEDMPRADLLLVMGTSLAVQPFAGLPSHVGATCPRALLNRDVVGCFDHSARPQWNYRDAVCQYPLDAACALLAAYAGWTKDLEAAAAAAR